MARKNNLFRIKIEHENIPIIDTKCQDKDFDKVIEGVKKKFRGII